VSRASLFNPYAIRNPAAGIFAVKVRASGRAIPWKATSSLYTVGAGNLAGLVERIGNGKRRAFGSKEELWAFLTDRGPSRKGFKGKQRSDVQG
jgi:hypothetical protein